VACWADAAAAVGMALAERRRQRLVIVFLGDGAFGEGAVFEALNLAALWRLPVFFVIENNRYAQTTPIHLHLAGSIPVRFEAFGIPVEEKDTTDVLEIPRPAETAHARAPGLGPARADPAYLSLLTTLQGTTCGTAQEVERFRQRIRCWCMARGWSRRRGGRSRPRSTAKWNGHSRRLGPRRSRCGFHLACAGDGAMTSVLASLNQALRRSLEASGDVFVLGEDVLDRTEEPSR